VSRRAVLVLAALGGACEAPAVSPELARRLADGSGVCPWLPTGPPFAPEVVDSLGPGACIRVVSQGGSRFTPPGTSCEDVDRIGEPCAIFRAGEAQSDRWNDGTRDGEVLDSVVLEGAECRCGG
jgi:hypothetical protein